MTATYAPPVERLLEIGEPSLGNWPDYPGEFGLQPEHADELLRMLDDPELEWPIGTAFQPDDPAATPYWAPIHAVRALGLLRAESAVVPLTELLVDAAILDDWLFEDVPHALGLIGPAAMSPLIDLLRRGSEEESVYDAAIRGLTRLATEHPGTREPVVAELTEQLADYENQTRYITTLLVNALTELRATEAASLIEAAFAAEAVDISYRGDWEDVQIALGLLSERLTPRPDYQAELRKQFGLTKRDLAGLSEPPPVRDTKAAKQKAKKKRKAARASRKRNRPR